MPIVGLRVVFGQLPPADWLLGVSKVSQRNFVIGTGIGIVPGVFLFVLLGGGLFDLLVDMPRSARLISIGVIAALVIGRRVWKRRLRAAADLSAREETRAGLHRRRGGPDLRHHDSTDPIRRLP